MARRGEGPGEDVCRRKHGGNLNSEAANLATDKQRQRAVILSHVAAADRRGMTLDEVSQAMDVAPNRISGRFTALRRDGLIVDTGRKRATRTGCRAAVYVAVLTKREALEETPGRRPRKSPQLSLGL